MLVRLPHDLKGEICMCYFLYGALLGDVPKEEHDTVSSRHECRLARGTRHDVKNAVKAAAECVQDDYRITDNVCDCGSSIGGGDPNAPELQDIRSLIEELALLPGAKQINLCITWTGKQNKREVQVDLGELDLGDFLANVKENTLYTINLKKE